LEVADWSQPVFANERPCDAKGEYVVQTLTNAIKEHFKGDPKNGYLTDPTGVREAFDALGKAGISVPR
jgi:hypothetical protein